jgi:hypothetical protein
VRFPLPYQYAQMKVSEDQQTQHTFDITGKSGKKHPKQKEPEIDEHNRYFVKSK